MPPCRVVEEPGQVNPLLIFGSSGLGKTHLLNAIGHAAYERGVSVIYASAERFGNDYVKALAGGGLEQFRTRYRGTDMLLIDDVQFLEGKEKFQEEFFHTFNELQAPESRSSSRRDRAPRQLRVSDGLRSRLQCGLVADVQYPSFDTRLAILRAKAARHTLRLGDDVLARVAERCCPSVRELEGYLNRVIAYLPLVGGVATAEAIDQALSPLAAEQNREPRRTLPKRSSSRLRPHGHAGARPDEQEPQPRRHLRAPPGDVRPARGRAQDRRRDRPAVREPRPFDRARRHRAHHRRIGTRAETSADLAAVRTALAAPPAAAEPRATDVRAS